MADSGCSLEDMPCYNGDVLSDSDAESLVEIPSPVATDELAAGGSSGAVATTVLSWTVLLLAASVVCSTTASRKKKLFCGAYGSITYWN